MQQGQADILIARFPDPNYGVKTVNFIMNFPHLSWATPRVPRRITWRFLYLLHSSVPRKTLPCQNKGDLIWIFRNKANNNALGQTPTSLRESAESISGRLWKWHAYHEKIMFTKSLSLGFFKGNVKHAMTIPKLEKMKRQVETNKEQA